MNLQYLLKYFLAGFQSLTESKCDESNLKDIMDMNPLHIQYSERDYFLLRKDVKVKKLFLQLFIQMFPSFL